jgi:hypothetical protein
MIYGYKEMIDGRVATLAVAGDTVEEFVAFIEAIPGQEENRNWNETYASTFLDALRSEVYKGYKHSVLAVYHDDEAQRDAFWAEWPMLTEVQSMVGRDRQADMLHDAKEKIREAVETDEDRNKTIEERFGLDKHDPWDRRTEEEVAADKEMKKKMKEMAKSGEMSGDSFGEADDQRNSRERPGSNNVPGAYGRTQAQEALKEFDPNTDYDSKTNEELAQALKDMGVPDIQGVYDDDSVPQKAKAAPGEIFVNDIQAETNEDGSIDLDSITDVRAHKVGGEVDEVTKAARLAAHEENVASKKQGRRSFSPEDFAAVLRGDGSADSVVNVKGDDRIRRGEGMARPKLSDEAEAARAEHQENERKEMKRRRQQAEKEADVKARGERDRGIFKGADLVQDDDPTPFADLPEELRKLLEENGLAREALPVKNYPYNSELAGRAILPYDSLNPNGMRMVGGHNLTVEGTMTMNGPGAMVVSRENIAEDGYGIYIQRKVPKLIEGVEPTEPTIDVWLVRVRSA